MRNECNIIRDILPLYIDKIVSEDTISFVEEHLEKCAACRTELENMKTPNALEQATFDALTDDDKPLKIFAKKWNRKKRMFYVLRSIRSTKANRRIRNRRDSGGEAANLFGTFCPKEPGLGRLPNKHFCGPPAQQKFRSVATPELLAVCAFHIYGAF